MRYVNDKTLALDTVEHFPSVLPIIREWYSIYLISLLMLVSLKNFCYFGKSVVIYVWSYLHFSDDCGWVSFVGHLYVVFCEVPVKSHYYFF